MRRDAVFVVSGVARSCDLEGVFGRTYMRSHIYAIEDPILIARLCDRTEVQACKGVARFLVLFQPNRTIVRPSSWAV
jgi:hypothetical protein